jgi:P4 family phage/plasmid primase-like protien
MANTTYQRHELSRFLDQRRVTDGKTASMTGMPPRGGKWLIPDEDYPKFYDLLYDYLFIKKATALGFVEQPRKGEPKPLLIDLDFRYSSQASLTRAFNHEHIRQFCSMLVEGLSSFFDIKANEMLRFFVTLRPAPYSSGSNRKDGVHILCPDISLSEEKQRVLRNWMLSQKAVTTCFDGTGYTNADTDVYDESMVRKQGWIFYGESKPNIQPYSLAAVFKYWPEGERWEEEPPKTYKPRELMELLSVRYNLVPDDNPVLPEAKDLYEEMLAYGQEVFVAPPVKEPQVLEDLSGSAAAAMQMLKEITPVELTPDDQTMVRRLVMECLDEPWYETYDKWIRVGWCLHNINPSEENFQLWMDFSAKSRKSSGNNIAQLKRDWFHGMRKDGDGPRLTERSLHRWAQHADPEQYKAIISDYLSEYIRQELAATHYHVAKLMKKMFGSTYTASVNAKTTEWYKFEEQINMWKKLNQGMELKTKITGDVANAISEARVKLRQGLNEEGVKVKDYNLQRAEDLLKIEMSLYNSGFSESVMRMAVQLFYEEDFQNKLNVNPFLIGCKNGVIDLRAKQPDGSEKAILRDGRPEDYVSFLLGQNMPEMGAIEYHPYDPSDPRQAELDDFFEKLFPNRGLREYTLRLLASCLEGTNREQCFYIATGGGGNGKSKLMELMKMTFGDYQTSLQTTVLTRKRPESGAANPEIMAIKGRRFIAMQEPDDKEPINTSRMKQFSGEDLVEARALYGDQEKFVIMGKMMMMCNSLPPVTTMDRGTWRRIRVIEFISKFVPADHPELLLKRPNVFLMDTSLDKKLRTWREPFLSRLVHIYNTEYIVNGLNPVPAEVMKASDKYKEKFDYYARFRADRIREPMKEEERMELRNTPTLTKDIKMAFASWKKENKIEMNFDDALKRLVEDFGEPVMGKQWLLIKVFGSDNEAAEWDIAQSTQSI